MELTNNITIGQEVVKNDTVWRKVQEVRQWLGKTLHSVINAGKALLWLQEGKRYLQYGSHIETLDDLYREIGISRSTAFNFMKLAEFWGNVQNLDNLTIDHSRLIRAIPYVKDDIQAQEWLENAIHLDNQGFDNAIKIKRGGIANDSHVCKWVDFNLEKCSICNATRKKGEE